MSTQIHEMTDAAIADAIAAAETDHRAIAAEIDALRDRKREAARLLDALRAEAIARAEVERVSRKIGRPIKLAPAGIASGEAVGSPGQ